MTAPKKILSELVRDAQELGIYESAPKPEPASNTLKLHNDCQKAGGGPHGLPPAEPVSDPKLAGAVRVLREYEEGTGTPFAGCIRTLLDSWRQLQQTSGDLCEVCGWRGKRGDSCAFCDRESLKAEVERLRKLPETAPFETAVELAEVVEHLKAELVSARDETAQLRAENGRLKAVIAATAHDLSEQRREATAAMERAEKAEAALERLRENLYPLTYRDAVDRADEAESRENQLRAALEKLLHAVCGETGFAAAVRADSKLAYPWPALDIAEEAARAALSPIPADVLKSRG